MKRKTRLNLIPQNKLHKINEENDEESENEDIPV